MPERVHALDAPPSGRTLAADAGVCAQEHTWRRPRPPLLHAHLLLLMVVRRQLRGAAAVLESARWTSLETQQNPTADTLARLLARHQHYHNECSIDVHNHYRIGASTKAGAISLLTPP